MIVQEKRQKVDMRKRANEDWNQSRNNMFLSVVSILFLRMPIERHQKTQEYDGAEVKDTLKYRRYRRVRHKRTKNGFNDI